MTTSIERINENGYQKRSHLTYILLISLTLFSLCKNASNNSFSQTKNFLFSVVLNQVFHQFTIYEEIPYLVSFSLICQDLFPDRFIYYIRDDSINQNICLLILKFTTFYGLQLIVGLSLTKLEIEFFSISIVNLLCTSKLNDLAMILFRNLLLTYVLTILVIVTPTYLFSIAIRYLYMLFIIGFLFIFTFLSYLQVDEFFLTWFINYLKSDQSRLNIMSYWCFIFGIIVSILYAIDHTFEKKSHVSKHHDSELRLTYLNYRRKIWHFFIVLIILPALNNAEESSSEFLKIVLTIIIHLFLIVELARFLNIPPLGPQINSLFENFQDFRDLQGPIVISYLYLIFGISAPIYMDNSAIGLIALGLGDSMASIIGKKVSATDHDNWLLNILKLKWFDTKKTVAGTFAFVVSCFSVCIILKQFTNRNLFSNDSIGSILICCIFGGIFEAISDLNDNILIPCLMTITIKMLRY